jgi:hypothetical protein
MGIEKKNLKIIIWYFLLFTGLALAAGFFFFQARLHQQELRNSKTAQAISEMMPIGFVAKKFGLPVEVIFKELKLADNRWNRRYTIREACQKNGLDCPLAVQNLNKLILK